MEILALGGTLLGGLGFVGLAFLGGNQEPTIEPGVFSVVDLEQCMQVQNCFYQNSISPYSRVVLVDLRTLLLKPDPGLTALDQYFGAFLLGANQALVMVGPAPTSRYYSWTPYLWRTGIRPSIGALVAEKEGVTNLGITERGAISFSSLTQGVNNFDFPNASLIAVIVTRNQNVFNREKQRILTVKPNATCIPLWIPNQAPMGAPLTVLVRTAFFLGNTYESFIANPGFTTYRSTYPGIGFSGTQAVLPGQDPKKVPLGTLPIIFKTAPLEPSELPLQSQFNNYVSDTLRKYRVIKEIPVAPAFLNQYGFLLQTGYDCIRNGVNCAGDTSDTFYVPSEDFMTEQTQSILVLAVNHTTTQRAFYSSLTIYDNDIRYGFDSEIPAENKLYYNALFSYGAGSFRIIERGYVQLPQNIGADPRTIVHMKVFVIQTPPGVIPIDRTNPQTNTNTVVESKIPLNANTPGLTDVAMIER